MYQTRHTFASLMLSTERTPLWVARMLGHTSTEMLYRHYGKFIRNRCARTEGASWRGLQEAGWDGGSACAAAEVGISRQNYGRRKRKGLRQCPVTP